MVRPDLPRWLARLYPFEPSTFRTPSGAAMSYVDAGPRGDEAVLLLHGNPTWSFHFRELIGALSPRLRCVAPDHIGMGLSEKPAGYDYTLGRRTGDVAALCDRLGLRRIHLVVHDWGGAIGFGAAVRDPARIGRIVILNTAAFHLDRLPRRIALCRAPVLGEFLVRGMNAFAEGATWMATASRRLSWDERRAYLHPYGSWAARIGIHRFIQDIPLEPGHPSRATLDAVEAALPRLEAHPKLIVWGSRDFCFDEAFLSRWRVIYPSAQVVRLESAGHYVLEDGGPPARSAIRDFLFSH